jgi:restriction system protein
MSIKTDIKGWFGEKITQAAMWASLDNKEYRRYNDVILKTSNGTTQIDHIILSKYGLFVIETKNYQGWIFGGASQKEWTQSIFGNKNRFQNPLHQNYKHTKALAEHLEIDHAIIRPIIWFIGNVTFKTSMPSNVIAGGLIPYIKDFNSIVFTDGELARLAGLLSSYKADKNVSSRDHVDQIRERFDSDTKCPKCGSALVQRTVKQSENAGKVFLGCTGFLKCRFVRNV